uniref:Uncharacterized protein n=1 Tax=Arundo donax TaxID=35708 RepID=A0A0A9AI33_ARUDO
MQTRNCMLSIFKNVMWIGGKKRMKLTRKRQGNNTCQLIPKDNLMSNSFKLIHCYKT